MNNLVFSGNAVVDFEGEGTFDQMVISQGKVQWSLVAEDEKRVVITDHRPVGFLMMARVKQNPQAVYFYPHFHAPAQVKIYEEAWGDIRIELFDTFDSYPVFNLLITSEPEARTHALPVFQTEGWLEAGAPLLVHLEKMQLEAVVGQDMQHQPVYVS